MIGPNPNLNSEPALSIRAGFFVSSLKRLGRQRYALLRDERAGNRRASSKRYGQIPYAFPSWISRRKRTVARAHAVMGEGLRGAVVLGGAAARETHAGGGGLLRSLGARAATQPKPHVVERLDPEAKTVGRLRPSPVLKQGDRCGVEGGGRRVVAEPHVRVLRVNCSQASGSEAAADSSVANRYPSAVTCEGPSGAARTPTTVYEVSPSC